MKNKPDDQSTCTSSVKSSSEQKKHHPVTINFFGENIGEKEYNEEQKDEKLLYDKKDKDYIHVFEKFGQMPNKVTNMLVRNRKIFQDSQQRKNYIKT